MSSVLLPDTVNSLLVTFFFGRNLQFTAYFCLLTHYIMGRWLSRACRFSGAIQALLVCTLDWQMNMMYFLYQPRTDIVCHHPPHETRQFPCYCCNRYVSCFAMPYKFIVPASKSRVRLVSIRYDLCRISLLSGFQIFGFMPYYTLTDTSCGLDQKLPQMNITCFGQTHPVGFRTTGILSRCKSQKRRIDISFCKSCKISGLHNQ